MSLDLKGPSDPTDASMSATQINFATRCDLDAQRKSLAQYEDSEDGDGSVASVNSEDDISSGRSSSSAFHP